MATEKYLYDQVAYMAVFQVTSCTEITGYGAPSLLTFLSNSLNLTWCFPQANKTFKIAIKLYKPMDEKSLSGLVSEHSSKVNLRLHLTPPIEMWKSK